MPVDRILGGPPRDVGRQVPPLHDPDPPVGKLPPEAVARDPQRGRVADVTVDEQQPPETRSPRTLRRPESGRRGRLLTRERDGARQSRAVKEAGAVRDGGSTTADVARRCVGERRRDDGVGTRPADAGRVVRSRRRVSAPRTPGRRRPGRPAAATSAPPSLWLTDHQNLR